MKKNSRQEVKKVVLAYSGGIDTSTIVPWLIETYGCSVICFCAQIGQSNENLQGLEDKALQSGAEKFILADLREEFASDFLFPMMKIEAVYEGKYPLGTAISRPIIAKHVVETAKKEGADAVAHGATGRGNDQVRFELAFMALAPELKIIAPWREWEFKSREEVIAYARQKSVPINLPRGIGVNHDSNLWHISHEGGVLEDITTEVDESVYRWTASPENAPDQPVEMAITFEQGIPVALDGNPLSGAKLIEALNAIGGTHGIGRSQLIESRLIGFKSHGIYETPAGTILLEAHRALESILHPRELRRFKRAAADTYADLIYNGMWFTELREALDAFTAVTQQRVNGEVRLKAFKGNLVVTGISSPDSGYNGDAALFEPSGGFDNTFGTGFIHFYGLSSKVQGMIDSPEIDLEDKNKHLKQFKRD